VRAGHARLVLVLDAAALGAAAATLVVALGLPLAVRRTLGPQAVLAVGVAVGLLVTGAGAVLLLRSVGRAVDRILVVAESLGRDAAGELPFLAPPGESSLLGLSRAAIAFERVAAALAAERQRLAEKVSELERANAELVRARESVLRAERLATLGRIASGIAHEVGNPLGAIGGYAELARERLAKGGEAGQAAAADFLARIGTEAGRIDAIVRELLDLARPSEPELAEIDLAGPLDGALRVARVQARFRGVEVDVHVPDTLPKVVADERRLSQVFLNLLLNAGDAMAGAGKVRISAHAEGDEVVVLVADSGPGIPPEDLPRVFEPFFTTKAIGQGTGLGLALSHGIMESFGGGLSAANGESGAVFTVRLRAGGGGTSRSAATRGC
jgi:C4-dicarboxylate-specific signal transduction histidine kinase